MLVTIVNTPEPTMVAVIGPVVDWPLLVTVKVATGLAVFCSTPWKSNDDTFSASWAGGIPVPASDAVALTLAPALRVSVAALAPMDVGAKRTDSVQLDL